MTLERLLEVYRSRPFQPFRLQLADGNEISVSHPEALAFEPKHPRTVVIVQPNGGIRAVDLLLVAAVAIKDGRARRGRAAR
jgi:hypothetical protein